MARGVRGPGYGFDGPSAGRVGGYQTHNPAPSQLRDLCGKACLACGNLLSGPSPIWKPHLIRAALFRLDVGNLICGVDSLSQHHKLPLSSSSPSGCLGQTSPLSAGSWMQAAAGRATAPGAMPSRGNRLGGSRLASTGLSPAQAAAMAAERRANDNLWCSCQPLHEGQEVCGRAHDGRYLHGTLQML